MMAFVYCVTDVAYGEEAVRPERHTKSVGHSWVIVSETFHPRGVTIVWRTEICP